MSDEGKIDPREALKAAMKERALQEFERKWADFARLAGELGVPIDVPGSETALGQAASTQSQTPPEPQPAKDCGFTGSMASLIDCYQTHPDSGFHKLRYKTREHYEYLQRRVRQDLGNDRIGSIDETRLRNVYQLWTIRGVAMASALISMLRLLASFGYKVLKDHPCGMLRMTLRDMTFATAEKRDEKLTADDVIKIRAKAHEMGFPSMALAQAIQFETPLKQGDVIGEWVPISEPGTPSDVIDGEMKWLRGLRWSALENLMLAHTAPNGDFRVIGLSEAWMVREELARLGRDRPTTATPIIINEDTGRPYTTWAFRRRWREIADALGLPKAVKNMDSSGRSERMGTVSKGKESAH